MRTTVTPERYGVVLAKYCGGNAQLWAFHVSHKKMLLCLSRDETEEAAFILGVGCQHISGPFSWEDVDILITFCPASEGEGEVRIADRKAGFELRCVSVVVAIGDEGVPPDPFEGFLECI